MIMEGQMMQWTYSSLYDVIIDVKLDAVEKIFQRLK